MLILDDSTTYYSNTRINPPIHYNSNKAKKFSKHNSKIKINFTPQSCSPSSQLNQVICSSPTHSKSPHPQQQSSQKVITFSQSLQDTSNSTPKNTPLIKCRTAVFEDKQNPVLLRQPKSKSSSSNIGTSSLNPLNLKFNTFTNTENVTNFYEYTENCIRMLLKLGPKPMSSKPISFPFPTNSNKNKKIAVFDIDETLLHCTGQIQDISKTKAKNIVDVMLPMKKQVKIGINIRPHWKEALEIIKDHYEIVTYTASHSSYADAVLNYLDPEREFFKYRLYRNHCILTKIDDKQFYVKDLDLFMNYNLKNVVIIDNSVLSFAYHFDNGIPIVPYYDSEEDSELIMLSYYLLSIYESDDLRDANIKHLTLTWFFSQACEDLNNGYDESDSSLVESSRGDSEEDNDSNNNNNNNINNNNNQEQIKIINKCSNSSNSENNVEEETETEFFATNPKHKESVTLKMRRGKTFNSQIRQIKQNEMNKLILNNNNNNNNNNSNNNNEDPNNNNEAINQVQIIVLDKENSLGRKPFTRKKTQIGLGLKQAINSMHQKFVQ